MRIAILAGVAVLWPLAAQDIKPLDIKVGLWEAAVKTETPGMPAMSSMPTIPPETLAKLLPERRAQLEALMGRGAGGAGAITTKFCISRESLDRGMASCRERQGLYLQGGGFLARQAGDAHGLHPGNTKMSGDMTVERVDAEHVKGAMAMKSSDSERPMEVKMSFDNKWLSADCGDVKPAGAK